MIKQFAQKDGLCWVYIKQFIDYQKVIKCICNVGHVFEDFLRGVLDFEVVVRTGRQKMVWGRQEEEEVKKFRLNREGVRR